MSRLRLRAQLFIAALLIISALTGAILLILRQTVRSEIKRQVGDGTISSVRAFESVERQREAELSRTAALLAELPPLKAVMTTRHAPTVQDASKAFFQLAGSDLLVLVDTEKHLLGFHAKSARWNAASTEKLLGQIATQGQRPDWWYAEGQLYRVIVQPISSGSGATAKVLGDLAIGYQVDASVANQLAQVSRSEIVLTTGQEVIASTLPGSDAPHAVELFEHLTAEESQPGAQFQWRVPSGSYEVSSVLLQASPANPVRCFVLVPLLQSDTFLRTLNTTVLVLGTAAVLLAALLLSFVARTITRPLENLVFGVRALAGGDYAYSITPRGSQEVAELGTAFAKMRDELLAAHERRVVSERIAAVSRAASSLSHDLRHYLAAIIANAEFLAEGNAGPAERAEIYGDIKIASEQMTDLIDSLKELAREEGTISPARARLDEVVKRAVDAVLAKPEFRGRNVAISAEGEMEGLFDAKKIERVFFNLVLNACEATPQPGGLVRVVLVSSNGAFVARVEDNGAGIPPEIRDHLFDPFVSHGKPNGTGLGLAIVTKIVHEHHGKVSLTNRHGASAVFEIGWPRAVHSD
jgi:signal transduction histidine kinase